ncbi:MAG: chorismate synthase [Dehalococcoidia bacterium]|nr:MAG: chorismate synthase [Dehalococcoidia bacterium]
MTHFRWLTAGESHGKGLLMIVEGVPAGLAVTEEQIAADLKRRQAGYGRGKRQQIESDFAEIITGVRHGLSMGSPIGLHIVNKDHENANWRVRMSPAPVDEAVERVTLLRPGHADLAGTQKYGFDDVRPILERSSARETAARVAVGAIARALVRTVGIEVRSHTVSVGPVHAPAGDRIDWAAVEASPVRCADPVAAQRMIEEIDATKEALDTIGGIFEVRASGVPFGLGSHVHWDRKLDGRIAQAFMSINAVKAVEIGDGVQNVEKRGSLVQDVILPQSAWERRKWERSSNRAGGLEAGMTNGEDIVVRGFIKPIATIPQRMQTADLLTGEETQSFYERSDVAVVPAAGVIGEAMLAIVIADAVLEKFGGDHVEELRRNFEAFEATVGPREPRR